MGPQFRREYLEAMGEVYRRSNRQGKSRILDEVCRLCGCHRKSAIRALARPPSPSPVPGRSGPKPRYGGEPLLKALRRIWSASEQPCGKRLVAAIPLWLPALEKRMKLDTRTRSLLLEMSAATADRLLAPDRARHPAARCTTRPGTLLRSQIPVRAGLWDEKRPGYVEADTVAHCGSSMGGNFVWSLTFTDIASGWTENRATWNCGAHGVCERIADIERGLPFDLLGFDCDNGSEFLNHHLCSYFADRPSKVEFTRSRPYRKNDQAHVEQKNWTHVRRLLGYERLEHPELVGPINELYLLWGLLHNFYSPTLKLIGRDRVGSRTIKRYEKPCTPVHRLLKSPEVKPTAKDRLNATLEKLDPFELNRKIRGRIKAIHGLRRQLLLEEEGAANHNRQPETQSFTAR